MTMKCLWYDMIMIRHLNYRYIYIYTHTLWHDMKMIWNMLWYETSDKWHVYDMIYCDGICNDPGKKEKKIYK